jgi:hypothetical protein
MGGKFASDVSLTFLSALNSINTSRTYLMRFDVNNNMMAALSSIENKLYRI